MDYTKLRSTIEIYRSGSPKLYVEPVSRNQTPSFFSLPELAVLNGLVGDYYFHL